MLSFVCDNLDVNVSISEQSDKPVIGSMSQIEFACLGKALLVQSNCRT